MVFEASKLATINFDSGSTLLSIVDSAFANATALTSINIPNSVTSIEDDAFMNTGITSITIPSLVNSIQQNAFLGSKLQTVTFESSTYLTTLKVSTGSGKSFFGAMNVTIYGPRQQATIFTLKDRTTQNITTQSIDISGNLTQSSYSGKLLYPPGGTFNVISVSVGTSVNSIGTNAFSGATSLTSVKFAQDSSLNTIGQGAFQATSITSIIIPASVTSIDNSAFYLAQKLTTVIFDQDSSLNSIGSSAFTQTTNLLSITIPKTVNFISQDAFSSSGLQTVVFESITNLTRLGFSTGPGKLFSQAPNGVDIFGPAQPSTVLTITNGTTKTINIQGPLTQGLLQSSMSDVYDIVLVSIGTNVTSIDANAFVGVNNLRSMTIPTSVTSIGEFAFQYVNTLKTVIFAQDSRLASIGDYAFMDAAGLTSIIVPASVKSIGDYAFNGASSLTTVTFLPGSLLTSIGNSAFSQAYQLTSVTFAQDSSLTSIGFNAFVDTRQLDSITIPKSVTYIDSTAFQNSGLTVVIFESRTNLTSLGFKIGSGQPFCGSKNSVTISVLN
jgi:hypothetical protein